MTLRSHAFASVYTSSFSWLDYRVNTGRVGPQAVGNFLHLQLSSLHFTALLHLLHLWCVLTQHTRAVQWVTGVYESSRWIRSSQFGVFTAVLPSACAFLWSPHLMAVAIWQRWLAANLNGREKRSAFILLLSATAANKNILLASTLNSWRVLNAIADQNCGCMQLCVIWMSWQKFVCLIALGHKSSWLFHMYVCVLCMYMCVMTNVFIMCLVLCTEYFCLLLEGGLVFCILLQTFVGISNVPTPSD